MGAHRTERETAVTVCSVRFRGFAMFFFFLYLMQFKVTLIIGQTNKAQFVRMVKKWGKIVSKVWQTRLSFFLVTTSSTPPPHPSTGLLGGSWFVLPFCGCFCSTHSVSTFVANWVQISTFSCHKHPSCVCVCVSCANFAARQQIIAHQRQKDSRIVGFGFVASVEPSLKRVCSISLFSVGGFFLFLFFGSFCQPNANALIFRSRVSNSIPPTHCFAGGVGSARFMRVRGDLGGSWKRVKNVFLPFGAFIWCVVARENLCIVDGDASAKNWPPLCGAVLNLFSLLRSTFYTNVVCVCVYIFFKIRCFYQCMQWKNKFPSLRMCVCVLCSTCANGGKSANSINFAFFLSVRFFKAFCV